MAVSRLTIIKLAELLLAIAIFFIHYNTYEANGVFNNFLIATTYGGFAVIVIGVFIGFITGNSINKHVDLYFCVVGAILYIIAGILSYNYFQGWKFNTGHANLGLTKAALSIVQGIVFIVDAFFTFKAE